MHLLQLEGDGEFSLVEFVDSNIPPYAILSHTWGSDNEEVTFRDIIEGGGNDKKGYCKLTFCSKQAAQDGLQYFWVDSCCIDKSSSAELQESINSMFRWYQNAKRCYVYLSDVECSSSSSDESCSQRWKPAFRKSRWFTRGWTLQELIAPESVEFFSGEETSLGTKQSLEQTIHEITGIAIEAIRGRPLSEFSKEERLSWAAKRQTKRAEDEAYCLLGIFDIYMPLLYGEGRKNALDRLKEQISKSPSSNSTSLDDDHRRLLLDSLRFDQIDARHLTIKNAHAKTCKWLLSAPEYLDWLDQTKVADHNGLLWIKGKPGTGKSTLMKFALANVRKTMKDCAVVSFFFNARGEDLEKSTIGTYRSLLLQLLEHIPELQNAFELLGLSTSSVSTDYQWSAESLKTLLEHTIQNLDGSSVVCFIDALDECEEWQIRDMIQFFEHLGNLAVSSGIRFQVCFSSRHYPHITVQKGLDLVLEGQDGHSRDIVNYLESELKIGRSKVAQQLRTEIQEKASGIFMWVVLVVSILNKEHDGGRIHALRRRLQEIPGDLHQLFRDILTRDSHNRDELVLCIQWILFAKQPLNPEQLYFAILSGIEPEALSKWDPKEVTKDVIKRFILNSSKGLAEITTSKNQKVQFIHESVKDFLLKENGLASIWPDLGSSFQGQSHERLKCCCYNYLKVEIDTILLQEFGIMIAKQQELAGFRKPVKIEYPFLEYAVHNVLYHADKAAGYGVAQNDLRSFPLDDWIKRNNELEIHAIRKYSKSLSLPYLLAERNMSNLIRCFSNISSCLKVEGERYGCPLIAALATGSQAAIQSFLEVHLAEHDPESRFHKLYSQYFQEEQRRSKIGREFKFSKQRTVLSYLAEYDEIELLDLLLETGHVDVNIMAGRGRTTLSWAAEWGYEAVVKLLLEKTQTDVDITDERGRTPLFWAVDKGCERIAELLLNTGRVDPDSGSHSMHTPLMAAAKRGYEAIVKLLLETDQVGVDIKDHWQRTPLWWAASKRGNEAIVRLLIKTGQVDVDSYDQGRRTPLSVAAEIGDQNICKLLLETGKADINFRDLKGKTPLMWGKERGLGPLLERLYNPPQIGL